MSELKDKWDQFAGAAKKKAGELSGDEGLEERGRDQEASGKANELLDEAAEKLKDLAAGAGAVKDKILGRDEE